MPDSRPRATPAKDVYLSQLDTELGGVGLSRNDETGEIVAPASVTQQQLDDAIAAHSAVFPPDPQSEFDAALADAATKSTVEGKVDAVIAALRGTGLPAKAAARGK
jgi:FAD/FMN-containing dehydrogenase